MFRSMLFLGLVLLGSPAAACAVHDVFSGKSKLTVRFDGSQTAAFHFGGEARNTCGYDVMNISVDAELDALLGTGIAEISLSGLSGADWTGLGRYVSHAHDIGRPYHKVPPQYYFMAFAAPLPVPDPDGTTPWISLLPRGWMFEGCMIDPHLCNGWETDGAFAAGDSTHLFGADGTLIETYSWFYNSQILPAPLPASGLMLASLAAVPLLGRLRRAQKRPGLTGAPSGTLPSPVSG